MTVLPGFIDPHMHSAFAIMRPWLDIGPFTTNAIDDALAKLKSAVVRIKGRDWLLARLLDPSLMPGTPLTRTILDAISPDVPIFALENNGHCAYANSKAFELAGITEDIPDPPR